MSRPSTILDLHEAIKSGILENVQAAFDSGAKVMNESLYEGQPLIQLRHATIANNGANVIRFYSDETLYLAIRSKDVAIVQLVLENGAQIINDAPLGNLDYNSLSLAIECGNKKIVALVLQHGALVVNDAVDEADNPTPRRNTLHKAIVRGDVGLVRLVLASGANIVNHATLNDSDSEGEEEIEDYFNHTLYVAQENGGQEIIDEVLLAGAKPDGLLGSNLGSNIIQKLKGRKLELAFTQAERIYDNSTSLSAAAPSIGGVSDIIAKIGTYEESSLLTEEQKEMAAFLGSQRMRNENEVGNRIVKITKSEFIREVFGDDAQKYLDHFKLKKPNSSTQDAQVSQINESKAKARED